MLRPRIIPSLLISGGGLVKTRTFSEPKYVGDPINAVKIFNEKQADELVIMDIDASRCGCEPNYNLIEKLAQECRMPLCYGGGISNKNQALKIMELGVEKISIGASALANPDLLQKISLAAGSQSVVGVLDVRRSKSLFSSDYQIFTHNGTVKRKEKLVEALTILQDSGVGEIIVNSIDYDGKMSGFDMDLAQRVVGNSNVPITILGGAGSESDLVELISTCGTIGVAAGSLFVFKGKFRAVLINYPNPSRKDEIFDLARNQIRKMEKEKHV